MSTPDHTNPKQTSSPRFSSPPPNSGSTGTADFMMSPIGHATAIGQSDFRTSATDPRLDFRWKRFFYPIFLAAFFKRYIAEEADKSGN